MKKNKKIVIATISAIILLILIIIIRVIVINIAIKNKEHTSIKDFNSIKEIIQYMGCEYIGEKDSESIKFALDIYLKFKEDLYTNGKSNEIFYNELIKMLANEIDFRNFRLIDDDKQLVIVVICDSNKKTILNIYINGDNNYFGKLDSENKLNNFEISENRNLDIQSKEIKTLINNNWISSKINFGTQESTFNKYNIYFDEGIEIRTIQKKVFNIVFTNKYKETLVNGIKVGTSLENIEKILGTPDFTLNNILGYKSKDIYIFFGEDEVSVYRAQDEYDSDAFIKLVNKFNQDKNIKKFVSSVTDLWTDYDYYNYDNDYIDLGYTLKGIQIQFNITSNHGVIIYNNYLGKINNTETLKTKTINSKMLDNMYMGEGNLVTQTEEKRTDEREKYKFEYYSDHAQAPGDEDINTNVSSKFYVYKNAINENDYNIKISAINKDYPEFEIEENINSHVWINDDMFIYGITNVGLFLFNATSRQKQLLLEGQNGFNIKKYEKNILYYDDTSVELK